MTYCSVAQEVWESTAMAASKLVASRRYYFVHQGSLDKIMNLNYYKE